MTGMADIVATVQQQLRERLDIIDMKLAEHDALRAEGDIIRRMLATVPETNGRASKGQLQDAILEYVTDVIDAPSEYERQINRVVARFTSLSHAKDPQRAVRASIAGLIKAGKIKDDDGFLRAAK